MSYVPLLDLWLPILLSGVAVFIVSALIWTVLPHHKKDIRKLPNEDAVMAAVKGTAPGQYGFPNPGDMAGWKDPAWQAKYAAGPVGFVNVIPAAPPGMGRQLVLSFSMYLLISIFVGYLTSRTLAPGTDYLQVFRVAGTVAFLGNGMAVVHDSIWFGRQWGNTVRHLIDSLVYGLVTGGIFGWLWPAM